MLYHLRPRIYTDRTDVSLIDIEVQPFRLLLVGADDVMVRKPYPNKNYHVACRKGSRKAIDGFLIETDQFVEAIRYVARWDIGGEVLAHDVTMKIIDQDFGLATENSVLWMPCSPMLGGWSSREPEWMRYTAPVHFEPRMEVYPYAQFRTPPVDRLAPNGMVRHRQQTIEVPTVEAARLPSPIFPRAPEISTAFHV